MSKLKNTDSTATAAELGRILDLSEASIHAYARRGVIVRASRGRYRREESIRRYVRELRAQLETAQGGSDSATLLRTEKIRVAQEQANKLALANARERGELFDADAVEREWRRYAAHALERPAYNIGAVRTEAAASNTTRRLGDRW